MGVSYGIDLSKLDVCFGGFSPTVLGEISATSTHIDEVKARLNAIVEANKHASTLASLRESDLKQFIDDEGSLWEYVEVDSTEICVKRCLPKTSKVVIPDAISGKPVVKVDTDCFASLKGVKAIVFPDTIVALGACVCRYCSDLEEVFLPDALTYFDSGWFRGCSKLHTLGLPGGLPKIDPSIFDISNLRKLVIGSGTQDIAPGAFIKSQLEEVSVSTENPFMSTDGCALYNKDGSVMAAMAKPMSSYAVLDGCKAIGKKGFSNFHALENVSFPDSLEVLGEFSLAKTSISKFVAPISLQLIMEKAFFDCERLNHVELNEGLIEIARDAFTNTSIVKLQLPSSIKRISYPIAARTSLTYSGNAATFKLHPQTQGISIDEFGGLYREEDDGLHLVYMLDERARTYSVAQGCVVIDAKAFADHQHIQEVILPESLKVIGAGAFKNAISLNKVSLNEGLIEIADEAFLETQLTSLFIPSTLEKIGRNAVVTHGSKHGKSASQLHNIVVSPNNPSFYIAPGLLLERKNERTSKVVLCIDDRDAIHIPPEVDEIEPYAFNDAENVRELYLSDRISTIGIRGLAIGSAVELIHIDLMKPIDGHEYLELRFPSTDRGKQQLYLALSTSNFVNVENWFAHYDTAITNASGFDPMYGRGMDLYDQAKHVIGRLKDPIFLSETNKESCNRILAKNIVQICVEIAKHDDTEAIDDLVELGFLNKDNLSKVIDRVGAVQDASITGYLLEINRRLRADDIWDFEL